MNQITTEYKEMRKIDLESFKDYFERVAAARDAQEHVEDFEASEPLKKKFLGASAAISIAIAVLAFIAGFMTGSPLFTWVGLVCFGFATYNSLYIVGCKVEGTAGERVAATVVIALVSGLCVVVYYTLNYPDSLIGEMGFYVILALGGVLVVITGLKLCEKAALEWGTTDDDEELGLNTRRSSVRNTVTQLGKGSDQMSGKPYVSNPKEGLNLSEHLNGEAPAIKKESQSASESPGGRVFRIKKKSQSAAESPGRRISLDQTTESGVLPPRSSALEGWDRSARPGDRGTPTSQKNSRRASPSASPSSSKERSSKSRPATPVAWAF
jgi:hypothetical protein